MGYISLDVSLRVGDVLHLEELGQQFDAVTDSGVFHVFADDERPVFVRSLKSALRPGSVYYMMCFSDLQPGGWGARRVSQAELRSAFADGWSVESIKPARFEVNIDPNGFRRGCPPSDACMTDRQHHRGRS